VQIVVVPVPAGRGESAHEHVDIRYVLATAEPERSHAESSDAAVQWMTFDEARAEVAESNLLEFVTRVERLVDDVGNETS
jgi:hypothetical protein